MHSNYKLIKARGFNPFLNKFLQLERFMSQNGLQQSQQQQSDLNLRQIALIINNQRPQSKETSDSNKDVSIKQNYELHVIRSSVNSQIQQISKQKLIMFNDILFCQKKFDKIFQSKNLQSAQRELFYDVIYGLDQNRSTENCNVLIYLANSTETQGLVVHGFNQKDFGTKLQQLEPDRLLHAVYRRMKHSNQQKTPEIKLNSQIYFSALGIEKEDKLYDLLDLQDPSAEFLSLENLQRKKIQNQQDLTELMLEIKIINARIQPLMGEIYHFYSCNSNFETLNQFIILKIDQNFTEKYTKTKTNQSFFRCHKQYYTVKISNLIIKLGLYARKFGKNKPKKQFVFDYNRNLPKQIRQSKIQLYLKHAFKNLNTRFTIVNQVDCGAKITDEIRKLEFTNKFNHQKISQDPNSANFYYAKLSFENPLIKQIISNLSVKPVNDNPEKQSHRLNLSTFRMFNRNKEISFKIFDSQDRLRRIFNNQLRKEKKCFNHKTQRSVQEKKKRQMSMMIEGEQVQKKSFFCNTINSSYRKYSNQFNRFKS